MDLETEHAPKIIHMLEQAQSNGFPYVVFEMRPMEHQLQPHQVDFFETLDEALDVWEAKAGYGYLPGGDDHPVYYRSTGQMLAEIKEANLLNNNGMNRMNLENLQGEMKALKFSPALIQQMEKEMAKGLPAFQLYTQLPADKGQLDVTLNFRQSGQSDYYYFNRYDLALSKAKPLEDDKKYIIISPNPEKKGENLTRKFDSVLQAIDYFKAQKQTSELAVGKSVGDKMTLATMDKGKVDYVNKDFRTTYYSPAITNSQYVNRGKGFTVEQAANMLQGRAVYRDDLVNRAGEQYKAWSVNQFDEPKDKYGNFKVKQYSEGYGFDVAKELDSYKIKGLDNDKLREGLIQQLQNGNRPVVTVTGADGQEQKLHLEAMPRYTNLNFYQANGKPEKREQFLKEPSQDLGKGQQNIFEKKMSQQKQQGLSV
ncbi:hypothetical protein [Mucilaginibacter sp.]|uniref:hypothetical protein n=1 Tax=Mucilaginibacter sp. TaxID=1882438 RepID=UPI0035BBE498